MSSSENPTVPEAWEEGSQVKGLAYSRVALEGGDEHLKSWKGWQSGLTVAQLKLTY